MYAVIKTGGKQYRVAKEDKLTVEKIAGAPGTEVDLGPVLLLGDGAETLTGTPFVEGAKVTAEVLEQKRDKKVIVFKKQRRKNHRRTHGHRQELTVLQVTDIVGPGAKEAEQTTKAEAEPQSEETLTEETQNQEPAASASEEAAAPEETGSEAPAESRSED